MERAKEIEWLRWFYQNCDRYITEDQREVLEESFIKREGVRLPKEYEVD